MDPRVKKLSELLTSYSCRLRPGEKVLIDYEGEETKPLVRQLIKDAYKLGAKPYVNHRDSAVLREILLGADEEQIKFLDEYYLYQMKGMDAYIAIRGNANVSELSDVPSEKLNMYNRLTQPTLDYRVNKTKWVILRYPNASMAQLAGKSQEAFEDFYFDVCTLDYQKMSDAMDALVDRMNRTDKVRLVGPDTDLTFSIRGMRAIKCAGDCNIPDGEVYTAPLAGTLEGVITYNTPSLYQGRTFENVCLRFEKGRIVEATANDTEHLNAILDTDPGARAVGEFAIGVNPYITSAIKDTLFDEKITGSFHLTPGRAYSDCDNGNRSAIHWDLVCIQTPEYGGGEMYFDGELIRKDGRFIPEDLQPLNPENLK